MKDIQAFMKFAGTLNSEQYAQFMSLVGVKLESDPTKPRFGEPVDSLFEPGDVVYLASGGPAMTIEKILNGAAAVVWFGPDEDADLVLCSADVQLAALVHDAPVS